MHRILGILFALLVTGVPEIFAQTTDTMILQLSGTQNGVSRPFSPQSDWTLRWTAARSPLKIELLTPGTPQARVITDVTTASYVGGRSPVFPRGDNYTLRITSPSPWHVAVQEVGAAGAVPLVFDMPGFAPMPGMGFHTQRNSVASFSGMNATTTPMFVVNGMWGIDWKSIQAPFKISLVSSDGGSEIVLVDEEATAPTGTDPEVPQMSGSTAPAASPAMPTGVGGGSTGTGFRETGFYQGPSSGSFHLQVTATGWWWAKVYQISHMNDGTGDIASDSSGSSSNDATHDAPTPPPAPAPTVTLPADTANAVVLIRGDRSEGTGFLVKMPDGPVVVTNLHVLANNPNFKITTSSGASVQAVSMKGAADRDLALIAIKDGGYKYVELATDITTTSQPGDDVVTPGNSQGGGVMLNTQGKVLAFGPNRVEIDNPIYHGNSGGPIIHTKSGKVLGVVTEAMKVDNTDDLDKASSQNSNSAISGSMRYFGLRLDNVPNWINVDWRKFLLETTFLDQFHARSMALYSYLNGDPKKPEGPDPNLYMTDQQVKQANDNFYSHVGSGDAAQRMDYLRQLLFDLQSVADTDLKDAQNPNNFYSFNQERARHETNFRNALKQELDQIGNDVSRLSGMPRQN